MNQNIVLEKISFDGDVSAVQKAAKTVSNGEKAPSIVAKMDTLEALLHVYERVIRISKAAKGYLDSDMKKMKSAASEMERTDQSMFLE